MAGFAAFFLVWRTAPKQNTHRLGVRSTYQNTQPGVNYVGDAACMRCHAEIAATYRLHPMGRSLTPIADAASLGAGLESSPPRFEAQGLVYSVEHQGGRVFHREARQDASGRTIAEKQAEVQYIIGSGRQAFSYLIERDGFMFESPITWYATDRRWGLSPSYETRNYHFERPILSECLFCHANRAERVTSAINRYRTPVFQGHAIGCERCHGPGEFHVRRPTVVGGRDVTIVNPADLEPSLRDAVCEQCHLIGPRRVSRLGTRSEDFRPGLAFYRFWSVFVPGGNTTDNRFAGQVEQMHDSRCYQASQGRLGCISCHDPHVMPTPEVKAAYFRDRCLECHAGSGCRVPEEQRRRRNGGDDCIGCHMPRSNSSNNSHVATTNHRIPRNDDGGLASSLRLEEPARARATFEVFHGALMDGQERAATERDRGIALCRGGGEGGSAAALPLLEAAVAARPDDLPALECKGEVLGRLGRPEEGLAAYRMVLSLDPTRQTALEGAAYLASRSGRLKDAIAFWRQAIAVNPWRSDYHAELALAELQRRDWAAAAKACREALRLNPSLVQARKWLVECDFQLGNRQTARNELETLIGFDPPDRELLLRRFKPLFEGR
jgi:tetratricopeptide (TPR) repeat protein